jgi:hypothetical protein
MTLWRVDGFEESGSSAGQFTCLVLTTGAVPDADAALEEVVGSGASWVYVESIRHVDSSDLGGKTTTVIDAVANQSGLEMDPIVAMAVAGQIMHHMRTVVDMRQYIHERCRPPDRNGG